jgi:hypothetical protein
MKIILVGDSHTRIFKHFGRHCGVTVEAKPRGAVTMYRVVRDGIDAILSRSHERKQFLEQYDVQRGDIVVYSFGYVDILNNILRHDVDIIELTKKYVTSISQHADLHGYVPIIQVDSIPQPEDLKHTHFGSLKDRNIVRKEMRENLIAECGVFDIGTIEYCDWYENLSGNFDNIKGMSEDNAHIGHRELSSVNCKGCIRCYSNDVIERVFNRTMTCIRESMGKHSIFVVGKKNVYVHDKIHDLFKNKSFINCLNVHDHSIKCNDDSYKCIASDSSANNNRRNHCPGLLTYSPVKYSFGKSSNKVNTSHSTVSNTDEIFTQYDKFQKLSHGWPTTGMIALYHFSKTYKYVYTFGFSHFTRDGEIMLNVDSGLIDAYDHSTGRHSYEYECFIADMVRHKIFPLF